MSGWERPYNKYFLTISVQNTSFHLICVSWIELLHVGVVILCFTTMLLFLQNKKYVFTEPGCFSAGQEDNQESRPKLSNQEWSCYGDGWVDDHVLDHLHVPLHLGYVRGILFPFYCPVCQTTRWFQSYFRWFQGGLLLAPAKHPRGTSLVQ